MKAEKHGEIISFSGGRTSAYMTKRLIDENPKENYLVIFCNTGKEAPETLDFVNKCDKRWKLGVIWLEYRKGNKYEVVNYKSASRDGRPFDELIENHKGFLPNTIRRFCTVSLKIDTLRRYLKDQGFTSWSSYVGIRYDEPRRWNKADISPNYVDVIHPLVTWRITKQNVLDFWAAQDFDLKLKEPYGNCDCCFLKSKSKLLTIAKERPDLLEWWIKHEQNTEKYQNKSSGGFKQNITYKQILEISSSQIGLFDDEPNFECFCNID